MENNDILPTIIRDTREKAGYGFTFIRSENCSGMEVDTLKFGDYAIKNFPDLIVIERKQDVDELCTNLGVHRERFERELKRMNDANVKFKFIIVEDYWSSVLKQCKYSKMPPNTVFESIISLEIKYGIHFIFAGSHEVAHRITRSLLLKAWKYRVEGVV